MSRTADRRWKVWQYNCNRGKAVMVDLNRDIIAEKVDVALLQEPYCLLGEIKGMSGSFKYFYGKSSCRRGPKVAVVVARDRSNPEEVSELTSEVGICVRVRTFVGDTYFASVYCPNDSNIRDQIDYLSQLMRRVGSGRLIVGIDANASHSMWHSKGGHGDFVRGRRLAEWIENAGVIVLNEPSARFTYTGFNGRVSDIDITIRTRHWPTYVSFAWKLHEPGLSDHAILETLMLKEEENVVVRDRLPHQQPNHLRALKSGVRWRKKNVYWPLYEAHILDKAVDHKIEKVSQSRDLLRIIESWYTEVGDLVIGRVGGVGARPYEWWTEELTELKRALKRARNVRERLRRKGRDLREATASVNLKVREYRNAILKTKKDNWKEFVRDNGNEEPWGVVYKICKGKYKSRTIGPLLVEGRYTEGWSRAVEVLLAKFFPPTTAPVVQVDDNGHRLMVTAGLIERAIWSLNPKKAPGLDGLTGQMARSLWKTIPQWVEKMMRALVEEGVFPVEWKKANLTILHKGPDRDKSEVGAYRPISLIPFNGKVLERMMVDELEEALEEIGRSRRQFGYKKSLSTDDAWDCLKGVVNGSGKKYVMGIFVDFTGAFDNLLWGPVLEKIKGLQGVDGRMWASYFSSRWVVVQEGDQIIEREVFRGCPQGSICGPYIWNMMLDDLLQELERLSVEVAAYADDLVVPIEGDTTAEVEQMGTRVLEVIERWGRKVGVEMSASKTCCMALKGTKSGGGTRRMTPYLRGERIKYVKEVKYLGVYVTELMGFDGHMKRLGPKLNAAVEPLKRVLKRQWGIKGKAGDLWFNGIFKAIALYGCTAWGERTRTVAGKKKILAVQKEMMIAVNPFCKKAGVAAIQVVMASAPWDLEVERRIDLFKAKRGRSIEGVPDAEREEMNDSQVKNALYLAMVDKWQERWESDTTGRVTHMFIKHVCDMMGKAECGLTWEACCLMTGFGDLFHYLVTIRCRSDDVCMCGEESEEPVHVIVKCVLYRDLREDLGRRVGGRIDDNFDLAALVDSKEAFTAFLRFAALVFERRRTLIAGMEDE